LIARLNKNPMKRALRVDKIRLAALEATLRLYRNPDTITKTVPTYRMLARPCKEMQETARRLLPALQDKLGARLTVKTAPCTSQVGSGALPVETLPSLAVAITPAVARGGGRHLAAIAAALRALPIPVVGRVENGALLLDLRCLEDVDGFIANLATLHVPEAAHGPA
jgi:L-seryl-tRNA(Ser) seleniumtransferase